MTIYNTLTTGKPIKSDPQFRQVELSLPSLANVPDGEIFDDLDDEDELNLGARVASKGWNFSFAQIFTYTIKDISGLNE